MTSIGHLLSLFFLVVVAAAAGCSVPVAPGPLAIPIAAQDSEGHATNHHSGSKTINLFVGGSGEAGDLEGIAVGLDYEYRVTPHWGIGGFAEAVGGLDRSFAAGLQAYWHAYEDLVLIVGAAGERHHDEWSPIARVGALYEFPVGDGWILSPAVFYDFSEHTDLLIYGVNFGFVW